MNTLLDLDIEIELDRPYKVWVNKQFEGVWRIPNGVKPHDFVLQFLVRLHGEAAMDFKLVVAPMGGTMEQRYPGLERTGT